MNERWVEIGQRLKRLRLALGYTNAKAFCGLIGVGDTAWNNWEKGRREIPIDAALRVCAKTGASLDYIYRGMDWTLPPQVRGKVEAWDLEHPDWPRNNSNQHAEVG